MKNKKYLYLLLVIILVGCSVHIIKNIQEPPGGVNGIGYKTAAAYASVGFKISRIDWPDDEYVIYDNGEFIKYQGDTQIENWSFSTADQVSTDWITCGKK